MMCRCGAVAGAFHFRQFCVFRGVRVRGKAGGSLVETGESMNVDKIAKLHVDW